MIIMIKNYDYEDDRDREDDDDFNSNSRTKKNLSIYLRHLSCQRRGHKSKLSSKDQKLLKQKVKVIFYSDEISRPHRLVSIVFTGDKRKNTAPKLTHIVVYLREPELDMQRPETLLWNPTRAFAAFTMVDQKNLFSLLLEKDRKKVIYIKLRVQNQNMKFKNNLWKN